MRDAAVVAAAGALLVTGAASPASSVTTPPSSAAAMYSDATFGYRATPGYDSFVPTATARPPYKKLWSRDFGSVVSAPVAVGGRVFAVVNADPADPGDAGGPRMELVGLDAATGKALWPQRFLTRLPGATVTFGGGLLYTQTLSGQVRAWDPASGTLKWTVDLGNGFCQYPPTWYRGVLYTQDGRGRAVALTGENGRRLWETPLVENGWAPVVVDEVGVWIGFDNLAYQLLDRATGKELRRFDVPDMSGGGKNPVALGAGALWLRNDLGDDSDAVAYDRRTGDVLRRLPADATPAFGANRVYIANRGVVRALDTTAGYATRWTYTSPRQAATVRLVAGGHVYVQDGTGELVVLDEKTGAKVWSYRLSAEPHPTANVVAETDWQGWTVPGLATAQGRLFAPAQNGTLIAFGPA
ncbi:outer membrane protein assembly factor BamB family protein [Streptomyces sp. NPDC047972]|uniref:outer membrane protein assembly factor BamB family protein n=1 Tax=Streptomyces sp. NPDC047972 TaxID=3365493 RepID=UPI003722274E